jgi:hypothetical protein
VATIHCSMGVMLQQGEIIAFGALRACC